MTAVAVSSFAVSLLVFFVLFWTADSAWDGKNPEVVSGDHGNLMVAVK